MGESAGSRDRGKERRFSSKGGLPECPVWRTRLGLRQVCLINTSGPTGLGGRAVTERQSWTSS